MPIDSAILLKLSAAAAGPAKDVLRKKTLRSRVARAVVKAARLQGIRVTVRGIRNWLARPDSQAQLEQGGAHVVASATAYLRLLVSGPDHDANAQELLAIIFRELIAAQDPARGTATSMHWITTMIRAEGDETRSVFDTYSPDGQFTKNIARLHPWRADEAKALRPRWRGVADIVHLLVNADNPADLFSQWHTIPPEKLFDAPADGLAWLGFVAADYGASTAAVGLLERAIENGAYPADYLWARAALAVDDEARTRDFLDHASNGQHPLAQALREQEASRYASAVNILESWNPSNANDRALRVVILSYGYLNLDQKNRAITVLLEHSNAEPAASGPAQRAAILLLNRGRFGTSSSPYHDFSRALAMALRARNARRQWRGDSVAAALVALQAATLSGDVDYAIRLTHAEPGGEATEQEASDPRLKRERAILLAMAGEGESATTVAQAVADSYTQAAVAGFNAIVNGDRTAGTRHLIDAYSHAATDPDRLFIAAALVEDGDDLPDLTDLASRHPEQVSEFQRHHAILTAGPDRVQLLRAHAHESPRLAVALADTYLKENKALEAARVLERAGTEHTLPPLLTTAARHLLKAGQPGEAVRACEAAIAMAHGSGTGEFLARAVMFDALAAQNRFDDAIQQARKLVSLDSRDPSARWALAQALLRKGDRDGAWAALAPDDEPIDPRTTYEARLWIDLAVERIAPGDLLQRAFGMMQRWADDEDLLGFTHANLMLRLPVEGLNQSDFEALAQARAAYLDRFPDSTILRAVPFDPDSDDPLSSFAPALQAEHEALHQLVRRVQDGELPLGVLSMASRTYLETAIQRAAGCVRSHDPRRARAAAELIARIVGGPVAIDATAVVTLSILDQTTRSALIGQFMELSATDEAYRDALAAQVKFGMRSTLSMIWDPSTGAPRPSSISEETAEWLATLADRAVDLFTQTRRQAHPALRVFPDVEDRGLPWLATLDFAIEMNLPFWCDDVVFSRFAETSGVLTFSTVDLLRHIKRNSQAPSAEATAAEAMLVHNYHVDLGFHHDTMRHAAELAGWEPTGAAFALTRSATWATPDPTMEFLNTALWHTAHRNPEAMQTWIACAASGLVADLSTAIGDANLRVLLGRVIAQPWVRSDHIPFIFRSYSQLFDIR